MSEDLEPEGTQDEIRPLLHQACSEADNVQSRKRPPPSYFIKFGVLFVGTFLANLDTSFVVATYNSIASDLGQASTGEWILIAYNLGYCVVLPMYGTFGDRYGSLPPLMVAYVCFGAGSALSGLGAKLWQVILGRILSGTGGAGMAAMAAFIITESATPDRVAVLRSYVNFVAIAGRSAGGPIGGVLTDAVGWRWSFIGQMPIAILCLACAAWLSATHQTDGSDHEHITDPATSKVLKGKRSIDFAGLIAFAIMVTSLLSAISMLGTPSRWAQGSIATIMIVVFVMSATALGFIERYYAKTPLIPLELIKEKLGVQMMIQCLLLFAQFSIVSNAASYFVRTEGASNLTAALHLVPVAVGNAVGALLAGRIIQRTKRYKTLASIGSCLCTLGFGLMTFRWRGPIGFFESLYIIFTSTGVGIVNSTQFVALTIGAPKARRASMVSLFLLSQQLGMMIGTSGSAALLHVIFRRGLVESLGSLPDGDMIIRDVLDHTRYAFSLPVSVQGMVISSYTKGFASICAMSGALSILVQVILASMKEQPVE